MRKCEDYCVDCPKEMGCLGSLCPYKNVAVDYCDACGKPAIYRIEGESCCEDCANQWLQDTFDNYSVSEKAELLGLSCIDIE